MKMFGLELGIGKKPTYLSSRTAADLNSTFLKLFEVFSKEKQAIFTNNYGFEGMDSAYIGFVAGSRIRRWLEFWQLITCEQRIKEKKNKEDRNQTYYILKPTTIGWKTFNDGAVLQMDVNGTNNIGIGIGKPYGVFSDLWKEIDTIADVQVTKATRGNWEYEFEKKYLECWVGKTLDKAKPEVLKWITDKIAASPKRKKFGSRHAPITVDGSQRDLLQFTKTINKTLKNNHKKKPNGRKKPRKSKQS